ncbi:MAG: hypothetical protein ACRDDY_13695 [Clostridium sp.]|uniref:hypothetical protein n=1 Tax=Clostridium sp. TaxID=1506 RepID=UPI003EE5F14C
MDALYRIYLESNIELSRSVVFYSSLAAELANSQDIQNGIIPSRDKREWKYFKHLNGDYHWTDPDIVITSMDTHTEIPFTKEVLAKHKKTLQTYRDEPIHIRELISKYPSQSMLIRGIINPVPFHISSKAKEGDVLWLDTRYIEPQEHNIRYEISSFISKFIHRNFRVAYTTTNDMFLQVQIASMKMHLVKHIMSYRYSRIKTPETHSYHITNYLASHSRLDRYVPFMTHEQRLFFYININWIERHIGHTETFDWLVEKLLTLRNLPAYRYRLVQVDPDIEKDEYSPTGMFARTAINLNTDGLSYTVDTYPIDSVVRREIPTATDNNKLVAHYIAEAETRMADSQVSTVPTKIVECAVIDPETVAAIKEMDVAINHWIYLPHVGLYSTTAEILNPVDGQTMRLDAREMFLIYWYAMNTVVYNNPMDKILPVGAMNLNRHYQISEGEYKQVLPWRACWYWRDEISFYDRTAVVIEEPISGKDDFSDYVARVTQSMEYRNQWTYGEHYGPNKDMRESLWNMSYANAICDLSREGERTFDEFFARIGLQAKYITPDTWMDLAVTVFEASTSWSNKNTYSLEELQRQMISCFKRLSSYRVQFIDDLIGDQTITGGNAYVQAGAVTASSATEIDAIVPILDIFELKKRTYSSADCLVGVGGTDPWQLFRIGGTATVDITGTVDNSSVGTVTALIPMIAVGGDYEVMYSEEKDLYDYIEDDTLDGFILNLDPVELDKCVSAEQLRGFFAKLEKVSNRYVVRDPISPSRKTIKSLEDLKFRG